MENTKYTKMKQQK